MNAEDYINKMYGNVQDKQKQLLMDAFTDNTAALDTEKQNVQQQTDTNLERTGVETQKYQQGYKPSSVSGGINQQVALSMDNQQKKNTTTLRDVQTDADSELERQRLLLGEQYAAAIKQAQAENDMLRAQQLYEEAKRQDAQFSAAKTDMGKQQAALLNQVYDSANEAQRQKAESETAAILSQLQAQREQQQQETDKKLTEVYVNALRQGKNQDEMQNAYGLGTGNRAQQRLVRALGTTEDLTALRGVQMGADATIGQKVAAAIRDRNNTVTDAVTQNERNRAAALLQEAREEAQRIAAQQAAGQYYGGYSGGGEEPFGDVPEGEQPETTPASEIIAQNMARNERTQQNAGSASANIAKNIAISQKNQQNAVQTAQNKSTVEKLMDIIVQAAKKTHIGS